MLYQMTMKKFEFSRQNYFLFHKRRPLAVFCKIKTGPKIVWKVV